MLTDIPPLRPRRGARKARRVRSAPVGTGPVLIAASYDVLIPSLTLTFDRAVNLTGEGGGFLNPETITVHDGVNGIEQFNNPDATGAGTATLVVSLFSNGPWEGESVTMTCGAGTGIVDGDGVAWAGVSDVILPFA
jgi:hypothetical protein